MRRRLSPAEVAALNAAQATRDAPLIEGVAEVQTIVGKTGPVGPIGETGPVGPIGETGVGEHGPRGETGATGPKGGIGPKGLQGDPGRDGVGPDEKVKVDAEDPEAGYLTDKLEAGVGIQLRKSGKGRRLAIDAIGTNAGVMGGSAGSPLSILEDGVVVGTARGLDFQGTPVGPVTITSGIARVPVSGTGGGSALTAKDEGVSLGAAVTSLDFTGAGVTATAVGNAVTVDIPGASGGDLSFTHTQAVAASLWTINHNLGKRPSVSVVDTSDRLVWGQVDYVSANVVTVTFSAPFSGAAYLN